MLALTLALESVSVRLSALVVFGGGSMVVGIGAIFGSGGSRVSSRGTNRLHRVGPIVDSTVKPLL